jgi:hypothetical protein
MKNLRYIVLITLTCVILVIVIGMSWATYKKLLIIDYGLCDHRIYSLDVRSSTTLTMYADQDFYKERSTEERIYHGILSEISQ